MNIIQEVENLLKAEYAEGLTQEELAARHHVRQQQIQHLLSGKRSVAGLSLETFSKMFPHATVSLTGDVRQTNAGQSGGVSAQAINGNNFFAPDIEGFRNRAIAALISWHTALRRETCFRLAWANIDEADRSFTIMPGKTARFGRAVYVPIHPELWAHLLTLPRPAAPQTPILSQWPQHVRYNGDKAREYFAGLLHALHIEDTAEGKAGFHSLRASFVTRCDEAGISRRATKGIAGHTDDDMTDLYSHDRATARQILTLPNVLT